VCSRAVGERSTSAICVPKQGYMVHHLGGGKVSVASAYLLCAR
jgi:hypothetical protein